jgi:RNA polymerase sigma-70 factor (ECF subfamily)
MTPDNVLAELPRLRRYARVLTGDAGAVDNLVLDTLQRAWARQHYRGRRTSLGMWLIAVMREANARRLSRLGHGESPTARVEDGRVVEATWAVPPNGLDPAAPGTMLAQFDRLPLDQREVLALVAVERLSYAEIADLLGVSVATVLATLGRAREGLRSMTVLAPDFANCPPNQPSAGPVRSPQTADRDAPS